MDSTIQKQFLPVLERRLQNPRVQNAKLRDAPDCYKIKLRAVGYRLVYQVIDDEVVVLVLAVDKREGGVAYRKMKQRQ
ncbi:MAG: type II toxin-antitoxin system RelE/ParE family toxin [Pseudomonadota bacterium]